MVTSGILNYRKPQADEPHHSISRSLASGTALSASSYQALEKVYRMQASLPDPIIRIILISTNDATLYE